MLILDGEEEIMNRRSRSLGARLGVLLGMTGAVAFAIHCGSDGDSVFTDGPCQTTYKDQCGKPCSDDTQCATGLYCAADSKCTADCVPGGAACANGAQCSPHGRCGSDDFDAGTGFGGNDTGTVEDATVGGDACADIDVTLAKVTPTVLLLLDQSSSMTAQFPAGSGISRWDALKSALIDPDGGIVKTLENDVSFGLSLYSFNSGTCPQLTNVSWKLANYQAIYNAYYDAGVINNTPTAESIMGVIGFNDAGVLLDGGFAKATTPGPKILVLATDGDPDTCANPNSNGTQPPKDFVVWAASRTFDAGIPSYVIGIGDQITEAHQQAVANVGQGFAADAGDAATIYRTSNRQQLVDAFNKIIFGVRSCKFTLNGSVVAGTENQGKVTLNGTPLNLNDPNGWKLNSPTELEILGTSCNTIQTSPTAQVSVRFPCGTVTNIPK